MPRSVRADRGQKGVLQWRNDTPVALACGCDLWSRWGKIMNGVADVTKHDAGQLTIDDLSFFFVDPRRVPGWKEISKVCCTKNIFLTLVTFYGCGWLDVWFLI
jgi:hypothetical protein